MTLAYFSDSCVPVATMSDRQHSRSVTAALLYVPTAPMAMGQRSFAANRPTISNNLPDSVQVLDSSIAGSQHTLKMHLFTVAQ